MVFAVSILATLALSTPIPIPDPKAKEILTEAIRNKPVPGAIALVQQKGKTLAHVAVGVRRHGDPTPLDFADPMHLGSVTKTFTGFQVALAARQKQLSLDDPLAKFFPEAPADQTTKTITLRHLLHHTSGIPDLTNGYDLKPTVSKPLPETRRFLAEKLLAVKPLTTPGSTFRYDNLNYIVLGAVLEQINRQPWEDQVKTKVFQPLKITSAGFGPTGKLVEGKPVAPFQHITQNEKSIPARLDNHAFFGPSATAHINAPDLAKWATLILNGLKGNDKSIPSGFPNDASFYRDLLTPAPGTNYALGWVAGNPGPNGLRRFGHSGSNTMALATLFVDPDSETIVIVLMNAAPDLELADNVGAQLLNAYLTPPTAGQK